MKYYTLTFDRPFVYMIMDRSNVPLFIGVVNSVE
jgi:serine protease inhibitor